MKPNRLSTKKHTLRFAVILSALILAGCASTQSTTSSTSVSSASSTVSTASTSEESGADETDSTGGAMNGTIGSVIEANLSFKNKDFYIDYSTEDTVKIDLSAPKEADGVKVSGSTVTITEAGTYVLSGTLTDGQVIIDAGDEDDVRLVLENASVTCTTTAPIYAKNADKVIISLPENTESTVTDTVTGTDGNDELTAAIFAKCDLSVNGTGTLNVNANANDGITSEDKLKITGGVLNITSADDGLVGKDAVLIKDGTVHITSSGRASGISTHRTLPGASFVLFCTILLSQVTCPSRIKFCTAERESSGSASAISLSARQPAAVTSISCSSAILISRPRRQSFPSARSLFYLPLLFCL